MPLHRLQIWWWSGTWLSGKTPLRGWSHLPGRLPQPWTPGTTQGRVYSDSGVRRIEVAECMTNMPRSGRTTRQPRWTQGQRSNWPHQGSPPHLYRILMEKRLAEAGARACTAPRRFFQPSHGQGRPTEKSNNSTWHAERRSHLVTVKGKKIGKALRIEKLPRGPCAQAL